MPRQSDDPAILIRRAGKMTHRDRYAEALQYLDNALKIDPANQTAWLFRGTVLQALDRYPEAYSSYDRGLGIRRSFWQKLISLLSRNYGFVR